ncbi:MAG: SpoIIE family protein phosphatase [Anaerolineales bacterium]|nr:SpoIIE family protein phosphatase [Anaerolineales bacterium]
MELQIAVSKVVKWASRESGDTLEMIERPTGGLSLVLVDGQHSGKGAKAVSNLVARKAIGLLAEGVRDGATARAAHDHLFALHGGKVQATLNIVSFDMVSKTVVLSRNNPNPTYLVTPDAVTAGEGASRPIGIYRHTKPLIEELPLMPNMALVVFTDGLPTAGARRGAPLDARAEIEKLAARGLESAQSWADELLAQAMAADEQRPADDISILVVAVRPAPAAVYPARRLVLRMPL